MSSRRFKEDIKPMDKASEAILALQPVTFRYKKDFDPTGTAQFGLVAEDVAKVDPDLVVRDKEGKPYSVRYEQVNAMLLNEFLKERKKVESQQEKIAQLKCDATKQEAVSIELKSTVAQQQKAIEVLTAQLQRTGGANPKSERTARCFKRRTCAENGFESGLGTQGICSHAAVRPLRPNAARDSIR